jgi:hypothetical protein
VKKWTYAKNNVLALNARENFSTGKRIISNASPMNVPIRQGRGEKKMHRF